MVALAAGCSQRTGDPSRGARQAATPGRDVRLARGLVSQPSCAARRSFPSAVETRRIDKDRFSMRQRGRALELCDGVTCRVLAEDLVRCVGQEKEMRTRFRRRTSAFALGDGRIGIHIVGEKTDEDDEDGPGTGKGDFVERCDLLLVHDPASSTLGLGRGFGVSQSRGRDGQWQSARTTHFLLGDVDADRLVDVGVIREGVAGRVVDEESGAVDHRFVQSLVEWHVYRDCRWREDRAYRGKMPEPALELPLLGLVASPVDVAARRLGWPRDSRAWPPPTQQRFIPAYRRSLPVTWWKGVPWRPRRSR